MNTCLYGDCRESMRQLAADGVRVQTCVTSPPYYGLRDYGHAGQLGLESTPEGYIAAMVEVFRCVRDLLADDGTLWLNIGDSYASGQTNSGGYSDKSTLAGFTNSNTKGRKMNEGNTPRKVRHGVKDKDLIGIPWMLAFALRADGWYLRQDIIWSKPNPMPESVTDRCTKAHEYLFLLSKNARYYFDAEAIAEPVALSSVARLSQAGLADQIGSTRVPGKTNGNMKAVPPRFGGSKYGDSDTEESRTKSGNEWTGSELRNRRSVWTIPSAPYSRAHFATYPPALIKPCILAGSKPGQIVLDPFLGSGTTAQVAQELGRQWIGCELNTDYKQFIDERTAQLGMVI